MFDTCSTAEDRPWPAETRAEARVRRLARLGDLGLAVAERLERQSELAAIHAETDAVPDNLPHSKRLDEIGRSFAQVSRAVSLAAALEDRIDKGLPAIPDDDRALKEREAREKRAEVAQAIVREIADPCPQARRRIVRLRLDLDQLLNAEFRDLDRFLRRPFDEIVARLRRDLGLEMEADGFDDPDLPPLGGDSRAQRGRGGPATAACRETTTPQRPSCEPPTAGLGPPAPPRGGRSEIFAPPSLKSASPDAEDPSIPCRERSLPDRAAQGRAEGPPLRGRPTGPRLDQPDPASKIACMGSRAVRGRAPPDLTKSDPDP